MLYLNGPEHKVAAFDFPNGSRVTVCIVKNNKPMDASYYRVPTLPTAE